MTCDLQTRCGAHVESLTREGGVALRRRAASVSTSERRLSGALILTPAVVAPVLFARGSERGVGPHGPRFGIDTRLAPFNACP